MIISGTGISPFTVEIKEGFASNTILALQWGKLSNGNYRATDRGSAVDVYESNIKLYGIESILNNFLEKINDNRIAGSNILSLSSFNDTEKIFGANIDYSSSISVTILSMEPKVQRTWKGFSLSLKLRALSPTFSGGISLPAFKNLEYGFIGDSSGMINKIDSYNNSFVYIDHRSDTGIFEGVFIFTDADMILLRNYIRTQRGGLYSIAAINGVSEMFGPVRAGSYPYNARLIGWDDLGMKSVGYWKISLKFAEEV